MNKNNTNGIVLVSGRFNVVHPGHLRLLRFAKECGERLVVAVEGDILAKGLTYINEELRLDAVRSLSYVDEAFIFNNNISEVIEKIRPNIIVKGREYRDKYNEEQKTLSNYGGKILFCSGETSFSSIDLLKFEEESDNKLNKILLKDFMTRKNFCHSDLLNYIKKFSSLNICVIGDVIVDEYITCEALGMSQEDPTIVVSEILSERFLGGAGIVAAHAASLGAKVNFFSIAADDDAGNFVRKSLSSLKVESEILFEIGRPTTLKKRYTCNSKTLLRVSQLHQNSISDNLSEIIYAKIEKQISTFDVLIFSDFNYGCLPQNLVNKIITLCSKNNVFIASDSQSSSQLGDITRFKGVNLITPTEREARIALKNREDGFPRLAEELMVATNAEYIILKMGVEGLIAFDKKMSINGGEPLQAINKNALDPSGAGDSLLVASTMVLALGGSIWESAYLGAVMASLQVARRGNKPILVEELKKSLIQSNY
jgi:rfaE bifunctional protein kinase chain/domain